MRTNRAKRKLQAGEVCIGHMLMEFASPGLMTVIAKAGLDFALIDTEHTRFSLETVCELIRHARSIDLPVFVRTPRGQYDQMSRYMDAGADGIMAPNVESTEEARRIIQATKYAPLGCRGTAFGIAHDDFDAGDSVQGLAHANEQSLVIAQVESRAGVANLDAIVSTEGIDVAWIGHNDLTQSMGIPGQFEHPEFTSAVAEVVETCSRYGKAAGFSGATPEALINLGERGFRCLSYSSDIRVYRDALLKGMQHIRYKVLSQ